MNEFASLCIPGLAFATAGKSVREQTRRISKLRKTLPQILP